MTPLVLLTLSSSLLAQPLAPYEPADGCYIGAYIELDPVIKDDIARFEQLTGKKHASYFRYVGYGQPFPFEWANRLRAAGAMPHIAWEPNRGLGPVQDDEYLRGWAQACAHFGGPIFLRFASEMNGDWEAYSGDPNQYIRKWRMVYDALHNAAPNVIMVWCPFATPKSTIPLYYPGNDYVDWVGVNVYSVVFHEGNADKRSVDNAVQHLAFIYNLYADRKPIAVCEYAATHFCSATNGETAEFAVREMRRMYESIETQFPRVRMINWFSVNAVDDGLAHNNYALSTNERVLATYRALVGSRQFLSNVVTSATGLAGVGGPSVAAVGTASAPGALTGGAGGLPPLPGQGGGTPAPPTHGGDIPQPPRTTIPLALAEHGSPLPNEIAIVVRGGEPGALTGSVTIEAIAGSALRPSRVAFELDGKPIALSSWPPYFFPWDFSKTAPGEHHIRAVARDEMGATIAEAVAAVVVVEK